MIMGFMKIEWIQKISGDNSPLIYFYLLSLNEDFKDTILLKTSFSGVVYLGSTLKNPFLTIWNLS